MFDDVTCMRDDARAEHFPFRQFYALEQVIFVFMPRVRSFEAERTGIGLENVFDDFRQIRFVGAGSLINAVARVKANALGGNAAERCRRRRAPWLVKTGDGRAPWRPWRRLSHWQYQSAAFPRPYISPARCRRREQSAG